MIGLPFRMDLIEWLAAHRYPVLTELLQAFTFLGEMIPQREPTDGAARIAREFKARLDECLERDEQGRPRLTVTLPNEVALENLARSLAALLA